MKVIQRGAMKIVPGKMSQAMGLMKAWTDAATKIGAPPFKCYQCLSGTNEYMHTIICDMEWESMAAAEKYFEKMMTDKDMQEQMAKWEGIIEDNRLEFLVPMPMGQ
jgi:hypothetical protein